MSPETVFPAILFAAVLLLFISFLLLATVLASQAIVSGKRFVAVLTFVTIMFTVLVTAVTGGDLAETLDSFGRLLEAAPFN